MSQFAKPTGLFGRILARGMAWGHRDFYRNTAKVLNLKKDDKFLEIGFGSGIFIQKYASGVAKVAGVDYAKEMVTLARRINRKLVNAGKADLRFGDVSLLPWSDNEFTAVSTIETFFFWPKPEKGLKEIFRVLKPDGRFVLEMSYNKEDGLDHTKDIQKIGLRLYDSQEAINLLKKVGFKDIGVSYFQGFWLPFKGYTVPKGMIIKGVKRK